MVEKEGEPARKLFFNDGFVKNNDVVLLASQFQKYSGSDISRVAIVANFRDEATMAWTYEDFQDAALSVSYSIRENCGFWMGHNGNILRIGGGQVVVERVPDTHRYGALLRIRAIGGDLYVCGMSGQVLRRSGGVWLHMDDGILGQVGLDFEDIGGSSTDDIYAVGMGGAICHYDGRRWSTIDSPTDLPLSGVRCLSEKEVVICGNRGGIYRGSLNQWTFIGSSSIDHNFWGVEVFKETIYVAYAGGLIAIDDLGVSDVDFALEGEIDCHRLHSNGEILWSIGIDTLLFYDGIRWKRVICPKNR
jgi:hypothetical protein